MSTDAYIDYTRRFFERWSRWYDYFARPIAFAYRGAATRVAARTGTRVLDIGCGTGEVAIRCARAGAAVTAVDVTPAMLTRARRKAGDLPIRFEIADARALPFEDATFDVATLSFVLHDMPRAVRKAVMAEAGRVARRLVVLDYDLAGPPWVRRLSRRGIGLFESPYFAGFAARGIDDSFVAAGLEVAWRRRLGPFFSVIEVSP